MRLGIILFITLLSFNALAAKTKIATCSIPATDSEPAGKLSVTFLGGDSRVPKNYLINYAQGDVKKKAAPEAVEIAADKTTIEFMFMRFIAIHIKDGQSSDSLLGVLLGAPAQEMTCYADLRRL